jgi:hypothetical protein
MSNYKGHKEFNREGEKGEEGRKKRGLRVKLIRAECSHLSRTTIPRRIGGQSLRYT